LDIEGTISYLLGGDDRLVRYNIPNTESQGRQRTACATELNTVLSILTNDNSSRVDKTNATKLLTLCAVENPNNRAIIGSYGDGSALEEVVSLLDVEGTENVTGTAEAGEAVWILSFNNAENIQGLLSFGALEALTKVILSPSAQERDKMWSLAAIQNLAASYCDTPTGHCWWTFDEVQGLYLHPDSPLVIDASNTRKQLLEEKELLQTLEKIICQGAAKQPSFPSRAKSYENFPEMSTWSAIGALRNIVLFEDADFVALRMKSCLCTLLSSPDWLESSKTRDALVRTGLVESCEAPNLEGAEVDV